MVVTAYFWLGKTAIVCGGHINSVLPLTLPHFIVQNLDKTAVLPVQLLVVTLD